MEAHSHFGSLPVQECVVEVYSCAFEGLVHSVFSFFLFFFFSFFFVSISISFFFFE